MNGRIRGLGLECKADARCGQHEEALGGGGQHAVARFALHGCDEEDGGGYGESFCPQCYLIEEVLFWLIRI